MSDVFNQMLSRFPVNTVTEKNNAYHEVMQEVILSGLYRSGFFNKAAFYGGTCLRIFYKLPRFSEDMDFSLLEPDENFTLEPYLNSIVTEFRAMGKEVTIQRKDKRTHTQIESAFLKENTAIYNVQFQTAKSIKIKIEVDKTPPLGFSTENKLLLLPFSFMSRCFILSDLFAGKMHAMTFRNWKTRVKGRDWYDFEWYVRNRVKLNFLHLKNRALQKGYMGKADFTPDVFRRLLKEKIQQTDMKMVINDVRSFLLNQQELTIWSKNYFLQLVDMIEYVA